METTNALPFRAAINVGYLDRADPIRRLDVLTPTSPAERLLPVAIQFECPGWKAGPRSAAFAGFAGFANPLLAGRGFITIAASIRSSAQAAWPAQLDDAKAVLDWALSNPLGLPIDRQQVAVWGQSAGGHVAAMLALSAPASVRAVVAISTPFDLADGSWTTGQAPDSPVTDLLGGPALASVERRQASSPIHRLSADQPPPMMIIHGTLDETVPVSQAVRMRDAIRSAGHETHLVTVDRGHHNLRHDPDGPYDAPIWYSIGHQTADFLSSALAETTR